MVLYDFQFFYLHSRRKLDRKDSRKFEVAAVHLKAQEAHLTQLNNNIMYCQRNRSWKKNKYCPRPQAERTAGTAKEPEAERARSAIQEDEAEPEAKVGWRRVY